MEKSAVYALAQEIATEVIRREMKAEEIVALLLAAGATARGIRGILNAVARQLKESGDEPGRLPPHDSRSDRVAQGGQELDPF